MNPIVTPAMFAIMRKALGLGVFQKRPTSNNVVLESRGGDADHNLVEKMIDMELLERVQRVGPAGEEWHIIVSDEGMRLAVDDMANYHAMADIVKEDFAKEHFAKLGSKRKPYIANAQRINDEVMARLAKIKADKAD